MEARRRKSSSSLEVDRLLVQDPVAQHQAERVLLQQVAVALVARLLKHQVSDLAFMKPSLALYSCTLLTL